MSRMGRSIVAIHDLNSSFGVASCDYVICPGSGTRLTSCLNDANQLRLSCLVAKSSFGKLALMRMRTCVH